MTQSLLGTLRKTPAQKAEEIGPVLTKLCQLIFRPGLRAVLAQSRANRASIS